MRKAAELQEEVMMKGLEPNTLPKTYKPLVDDYGIEDGDQLNVVGQQVLQGQILTDDDDLRNRIRSLYPKEVLVLRGDRDNSLTTKGTDLNDTLMKTHLSCLIVKHHDFKGNSTVKQTYLNRYLAIYILYNSDLNLYTIQDDVVRAFYI